MQKTIPKQGIHKIVISSKLRYSDLWHHINVKCVNVKMQIFFIAKFLILSIVAVNLCLVRQCMFVSIIRNKRASCACVRGAGRVKV
jgi:hypothetical protein